MRRLIQASILFVLGGLFVQDAWGYGDRAGSCESDCTSCHRVSLKEVSKIVKRVNPEIEALEVNLSPVGGLWEIIVKARGKRGVAYMDFSKSYIITGSVIEVKSKKNLTNSRLYDLSKVDVSAIPLEEALVMGNPEARFKAIVFDDPNCPYCRKLHKELKKIVEENEDYVFFIKMLPIKKHPSAYKKSKAIVCEKSLRLLERAFDGKAIPRPSCKTTEIEDNLELAERLGITGAPTLILPDGGVIRGYKTPEELMGAIETAGLVVEKKEAEAMKAGSEGAGFGEYGDTTSGTGKDFTPWSFTSED